jgi:hypothetical protein
VHKGKNFFTEAQAPGTEKHAIMQDMKTHATGGDAGTDSAAAELPYGTHF